MDHRTEGGEDGWEEEVVDTLMNNVQVEEGDSEDDDILEL